MLVVDAGFTKTGQDVVDHITDWYETDQVDLLISTHPDSDYLNGLQTVIERLNVDTLLIHNPRNHHAGADDIGNIERVDSVIAAAHRADTTVLELFAGQTYLDGTVTILGPTLLFYQQLLVKQIEDVLTGGRGPSSAGKAAQ